jgi:hypothetical protein
MTHKTTIRIERSAAARIVGLRFKAYLGPSFLSGGLNKGPMVVLVLRLPAFLQRSLPPGGSAAFLL